MNLESEGTRRGLRALGTLALLGLAVIGFTPLANVLHARLHGATRVADADAVVVLCSSVDPGGRLSEGSLRRAVEGIRQMRRGAAPLLVFTGITRDEASEAEARGRLAVDLGVDPGRLLLVPGVRTTAEEAAQVSAALRGRGLREVVLVTGSLHMLRAQRVFEKAGLVVHPATVEDVSGREVQPFDRLSLMRAVLQEAAARGLYRLKGAH